MNSAKLFCYAFCINGDSQKLGVSFFISNYNGNFDYDCIFINNFDED